MPLRTTLARGMGAIAGAGFGVTVGAIAEARIGFRLREHTLPILPAGASPIRVLHLSDFHMLPSMKAKSRWVAKLAERDIDLVVNTGDNMASRQSFALVMETLEPFLHLPGMFVFGSNDYYGPTWKNPLRYLLPAHRRRDHDETERTHLPAGTLAAALRAAGWHDLRNRTANLTVAGSRLQVIGVDDPHIAADSMPVADRSALDPTADLTIGLVHAPYVGTLNDFERLGVDLVLAGHTHGGQVGIPGYGALVTNCDLPTWRASGLQGWPGAHPDPHSDPVVPWHRFRSRPTGLAPSRMWINISAGLGTSPYAPIRLFTRPEASLLTLTAAPTPRA